MANFSKQHLILFSIFVFITLSCHANYNAKSKIRLSGTSETQKKNTITFLLESDQPESIYLNLLEGEYSYIPKLLVISQHDPVKTVNSTTSIEIGVTNSFFANTDFECIPGDSIKIKIINRQIKIILLNRQFNDIEWNLSYYIKKTNHICILEYYNQKTAAQLYTTTPILQSAEESLAYSLSFLDSLQKKGLLDSTSRDSLASIYKYKFKLMEATSRNIKPKLYIDSSLYLTFNFTNRIPAIVKAYLKISLLKHFNIGSNTNGDNVNISIFNYVAKTFVGKEREFLLFYCANEIKLHNSLLFKKNYESIIQTFKEQETKSYFTINQKLSNIPSGYLLNSANKEISFKDLIKEKLARVIYIDFWASWCAPCRAEVPILKKIKAHFNGLGIDFICISIDETFTDWQSANAKDSLNYYADSYILNNPRNSDIVKQIKLLSIPRYLIYNKKGDLVNLDAPSPDDATLQPLLTKLIRE